MSRCVREEGCLCTGSWGWGNRSPLSVFKPLWVRHDLLYCCKGRVGGREKKTKMGPKILKMGSRGASVRHRGIFLITLIKIKSFLKKDFILNVVWKTCDQHQTIPGPFRLHINPLEKLFISNTQTHWHNFECEGQYYTCKCATSLYCLE